MDIPPEYRTGHVPPLVECPECGGEFPAEDGPFCPYCEIDLRDYKEE